MQIDDLPSEIHNQQASGSFFEETLTPSYQIYPFQAALDAGDEASDTRFGRFVNQGGIEASIVAVIVVLSFTNAWIILERLIAR